MKVLVLRHVPHEHLGTLALALKSVKLTYQYVNFYENENPNVSIDDSSALIILGGPMNVYETDKYPFLDIEDELIKRATILERERFLVQEGIKPSDYRVHLGYFYLDAE